MSPFVCPALLIRDEIDSFPPDYLHYGQALVEGGKSPILYICDEESEWYPDY